MKNLQIILLLTLTLSIHGNIFSQVTQYIELMPYVRFDSYPTFDYSINPLTKNTVKINGNSWGINTAYNIQILKRLFIKGGIGYYRYAFNHIENENSSFGRGSTRVINYIGNVDPIFLTNKYAYNTISASLGSKAVFDINKNMELTTGLSITTYYTFSQYYRITLGPPAGPSKNKYKRFEKGNFGFSGICEIGVIKNLGKLKLGPILLIPIYDQWSQDDMFPQESDSKSRNKFFGGVGLGFEFSFLLSNKNSVH